MVTPEQYRAKAAEYAELAKSAREPDDVRECLRCEASFTVLAGNEQWLADHRDQTVHAMKVGEPADIASLAPELTAQILADRPGIVTQ
jgi:hypothetical protein